ncbi:MAG: NUDIX hydrolase [Chloroflexi bacterium]|nr:NUDIX hydrolase [Chloroflexota bacterium]
MTDGPGTPVNASADAWLRWAIQLQALAQDGMAYTENAYDRERYAAIRRIAAEMMATASPWPPERIEALFAGQAGYATPKVDVRGAVFQGGRILLVQEHTDGLWTLPGGWADPGDTPSVAVEREIHEESGYTARATRLLAVYDRATQGHQPPHPFSIYKICFLCDLTGGQPATSIETDAVGFFDIGALPPLSLPRVTARQIERFAYLAVHPEIAPDFD